MCKHINDGDILKAEVLIVEIFQKLFLNLFDGPLNSGVRRRFLYFVAFPFYLFLFL